MTTNHLDKGLLKQDRRALARAITLAESTRADHRLAAENLMTKIMPHCGKSIRIGISGAPGVGKSSFIETFGLFLVANGHRVAVLAIDPSSRISGGSILGDKTRMENLSRDKNAFIRPSPSGGNLGGVARRTRECMLICEAAGFDIIIIETVGVGQSETAVSEISDLFLLLLAPAAGDELQGIKKGIVELADTIIVNKADGEMIDAANLAAAEYRSALHMIRPSSTNWSVPVLTCSALNGDGTANIWQTVVKYCDVMKNSGKFKERRAEQAKFWMWSEIEENLIFALRNHPKVGARVSELETKVADGTLAPSAAAHEMLTIFYNNQMPNKP